MKYAIANWKSNKTLEEVHQWFDQFAGVYQQQPELEVVIGVPFPYLFQAHQKVTEVSLSSVSLASQDISAFPFGAYTGAVSISMIKDVIKYAIVGHSERRQYFHETHQEIANKVSQLLENQVTPILCIDEPYAKEQLAALDPNSFSKLIIAYEPLEAIGSGTPQKPEEIAPIVASINQLAPEASILYGGSVKPENVAEIINVEHVAGTLVGGASLKPDVFAELVRLSS